MKYVKTTIALTLLVTGFFAFVSGTTYAAQNNSATGAAIATIAVNVRNGPGTNYSVVGTLYAGEGVSINQCANDWCYINRQGPEGWVAKQYLRLGRPATANSPINSQPSFTFNQSLENDGLNSAAPANNSWPDGSFADATPNPNVQANAFPFVLQNPVPGPTAPLPFQLPAGQIQQNLRPILPGAIVPQGNPAGQTGQACFYDGENFGGQSTCIMSGRSFERLGPRWNDKISSMQVFPNARVTLCQNPNYTGNCATYNRSTPNLGFQFNNQASSIRVD